MPQAKNERKQRENRRRLWFERGHAAFEHAFPGYLAARFPDPVLYICPICQRPYSRADLRAGRLTFEDAPPAWYAGRKQGIALTCKPCNNSLGTTIDAHAARAARRGPFKARARLKDVEINVLFDPTPEGIRMYGRPRQNRPDDHAKFFDLISELLSTGGSEWTIGVEWREPFSERLARLAWLKAAYIVAFARFGYRWAFSPGVRIVRHQLQNIRAPLIETFKWIDPAMKPTARRLLAIVEPTTVECLAVQMGSHLVFLPFPTDMTLYDRLQRHPLLSSVRLIEYPWPKSPQHDFDFRKPTSAPRE